MQRVNIQIETSKTAFMTAWKISTKTSKRVDILFKANPNHNIGSIQFACGKSKILASTNYNSYEHKRYYHDTYRMEYEQRVVINHGPSGS